LVKTVKYDDMEKFFLSFFFLATFAAYSITTRSHVPELPVLNQNKSVALDAPSSISKVVQIKVSTSRVLPKKVVSVPAPTPVVVVPVPKETGNVGAYKNGEYAGTVADAYYGSIQVKAIIEGGKLADVQFLSYTNDRRHSVEVNTYAMPKLKSEAISIQSSQVDVVSGASFTSAAFKESLAVALVKAKNV
jgi:uncharacterized protein with FMN-binding domain